MTDVDNALEADGIIVGTEPNFFGIFTGGVLPHLIVPNAPIYSKYYRNTGQIFTNMDALGGLGSLAGDWIEDIDESCNTLMFFNEDSTRDDIELTGSVLTFFNADGSQDDIELI